MLIDEKLSICRVCTSIILILQAPFQCLPIEAMLEKVIKSLICLNNCVYNYTVNSYQLGAMLLSLGAHAQ